MVLTFEPVGEVLWCYNTSESCCAVLCCEAVYCTLNSDANFWTYQWCPFKLLDVSINNGNWTEWSVIWSDGLAEIINSTNQFLVLWNAGVIIRMTTFCQLFFICYWWCYQSERSLGLAILDLCPPGHLSQQSPPRWYHFWRHRACLGKFRTSFFRPGEVPEPYPNLFETTTMRICAKFQTSEKS